MPQPNENGHTTWYENEDDKQMVMNFLNHIKLKTGENNGRIILKALQLYNMELEEIILRRLGFDNTRVHE